MEENLFIISIASFMDNQCQDIYKDLKMKVFIYHCFDDRKFDSDFMILY